ncbi:MAG: NAD(P)-dependent oxidoreductase [Nocardioides sp.]|uniref:NAD(P)-dependent oxidoreductase n=1 Tax=Nocardioides sp. TaxID=35761 RepID=UPI003264EB4F
MNDPSVGVVGLGAMGSAIVAALVAARPDGRSVVVHDPSPSAAVRGAAAGGEVVSLIVLGESADTVILSLPDAAVVASVLDALLAVDSPPTLVVDTSTIGPADSRRHAELCAARGVAYVDAPVLGRPGAVGRWTIPVGGSTPEQHLDELLAPVAARVVPVGPVGSAATVKVVNNQMLAVINAATAEALAVAAAAGLDPGVFVDTVIDSGAASVSGLFRDVAPRAVDGDFDPVFSLALMRKDNALAVELASASGVPTPVTSAALALHTRGVDAGLGDRDSIAVLSVLEHDSGVPARRQV